MSDIYAAIHAIATSLAKNGVAKKQTNREQRYKFRGIDDILNCVAPLLVRHGVVVIPHYEVIEDSRYERPTERGVALTYRVRVHGRYDFIAISDGSVVSAETIGEGVDYSDKATNKSMSQAFKYALIQTLTIPTGEPDPDEESPTVEVRPQPSPSASPAPTTSSKQAVSANRQAKTPLQRERGAFFAALNDQLAAEAKTPEGRRKIVELLRTAGMQITAPDMRDWRDVDWHHAISLIGRITDLYDPFADEIGENNDDRQ